MDRSIYSSFFSARDFDTKLSFCIFARITALTVPSTLTHTDPLPTTHTKSAKKQPFPVAIFRQLCYNGHASQCVLISCGQLSLTKPRRIPLHE